MIGARTFRAVHPRAFDRVSAPLTARISVAGAAAFDRPVRDIGLGGLYIETHSSLRAGQPCALEIRLDRDERAPRIRATGRVLRSSAGAGTAIEFTDMSVDAFDRLDRLIFLADLESDASSS